LRITSGTEGCFLFLPTQANNYAKGKKIKTKMKMKGEEEEEEAKSNLNFILKILLHDVSLLTNLLLRDWIEMSSN
jgi:hypothetical protein